MSEWQPIGTAPRDGTPVMVWFRGEYHVAQFIGIWAPENLKWCVKPPKTGLEDDMRPVHDISIPVWSDGVPIPGGHSGPTHWMPLPSPPTDGEG